MNDGQPGETQESQNGAMLGDIPGMMQVDDRSLSCIWV